MNITVASFTGTSYLSKPDPVLAIAGEKYVSCFFSPTGSSGILVGKSLAWYLSFSGNNVTFSVIGSDNITYTVTDPSHSINAGSWYFVEGYQTSEGVISVAVTDAGGAYVDVFMNPVTMGVSTSKTAGTFSIGLTASANTHTVS